MWFASLSLFTYFRLCLCISWYWSTRQWQIIHYNEKIIMKFSNLLLYRSIITPTHRLRWVSVSQGSVYLIFYLLCETQTFPDCEKAIHWAFFKILKILNCNGVQLWNVHWIVLISFYEKVTMHPPFAWPKDPSSFSQLANRLVEEGKPKHK